MSTLASPTVGRGTEGMGQELLRPGTGMSPNCAGQACTFRLLMEEGKSWEQLGNLDEELLVTAAKGREATSGHVNNWFASMAPARHTKDVRVRFRWCLTRRIFGFSAMASSRSR